MQRRDVQRLHIKLVRLQVCNLDEAHHWHLREKSATFLALLHKKAPQEVGRQLPALTTFHGSLNSRS